MSKCSDAILHFLKNNPRYSYNTMTLYRKLKAKYPKNTIRSELRRLCEKKHIIRIQHGFYKINISPDIMNFLEQPPTLLHGIMVSMDSIRFRKLQNSIHGIPAECCIWDELESCNFELRGNNKYIKKFFYEDDSDRLVTNTVHCSTGRIDVYLNCTNHPVNYFEFRDIYSFNKANINCLRPFVNERIVELGMNKDFVSIRMEGVSALSLRVFRDHWFRIYNKERLGVLRVEQHIKTDVSVDTFFSMFERMFIPQPINGNGRVDDRRDVT